MADGGGPGRNGYTLDHRKAGRYTHQEAIDIVAQADLGGPHGVDGEVTVWPEVMHLAPELRWQGGPPDPFESVDEFPFAT